MEQQPIREPPAAPEDWISVLKGSHGAVLLSVFRPHSSWLGSPLFLDSSQCFLGSRKFILHSNPWFWCCVGPDAQTLRAMPTLALWAGLPLWSTRGLGCKGALGSASQTHLWFLWSFPTATFQATVEEAGHRPLSSELPGYDFYFPSSSIPKGPTRPGLWSVKSFPSTY